MSQPCVLVVADPDRIAELVAALSEPVAGGPLDVLVSSGGDDTIDLFEARRPEAVVVTATLEAGDAKALIDALRGAMPRAEVAIIVVGDDAGPIRTALDALDLGPDRFVTRPLSGKALRFAVASVLEAVALVRGSRAPAPATTAVGLGEARAPAAAGTGTLPGVAPQAIADDPTTSTRAALRARWTALADAMGDPDDEAAAAAAPRADAEEPPPLPPPVTIHPRRTGAQPVVAPVQAWTPGTTDALDGEWPHEDAANAEPVPAREPTLILREDPALRADPMLGPAVGAALGTPAPPLPARNSAAARRPTEPPVLRADTRRPTTPPSPRVDTEDHWPVPSGIVPAPPRIERAARESDPPELAVPRTSTLDDLGPEQAPAEMDSVIVAERRLNESWSEPQELPEISDRESRRDIHPASVDELGLDDFDDDLVLGHEPGGVLGDLGALGSPAIHLAPAAPLDRSAPPSGGASRELERREATPRPATTPAPLPPDLPLRPSDERIGGRDFARQLRAKMSQMAQRLFQGADDAAPAPPLDHSPRHDHHTEIDLAALGEEQALGGAGVTEIEVRASRPEESRPLTSPGSWDTAVRERGVPDAGELARGTSDAAMLLAKLFAQRATGRCTFRRDEVEKIVYFDSGRPVFAASNAIVDRMGELLVREGKITASQYERCQAHVAESGRRMGEILVDFGYLKRRELLPAVRRHVEDIIYSLFGWERGTYAVALDPAPSAERIRLSRHPASLILEGIRRKLDRTSLERLVGSAATVIELPDREKLGGIIHLGDLAAEERAALAAFDGQADLAAVARTAGVDVADVLPLAWGLCVLGLATARRTEIEAVDESNALVGETDLAIDRERVRARWQLVTEADYFALLGVRRDATAFEIRRAYQGARRDFAADCFPSDLRRELAQELEDIAHVLDEAFRVLRDDRLRLTYLHNLVE